LSSRQRRILELVAEGMTNQQIGNRLGYSESTIGHDLVAAYERLGVRNGEDAAHPGPGECGSVVVRAGCSRAEHPLQAATGSMEECSHGHGGA